MKTILIHVPVSIETERLILLAPRAGDAAEINAAVLESFDALHEWMPWAKTRPTLEETEIFSRESQANFILRKGLHYRAYLKGSQTFAASVSLFNIDWTVPKFEIGYWLRTSLSEKGYMTEAAGALGNMAIGALKANRVEIRCDEKNVRSRRVAERLGYPLEGIFKNESRTPAGELRNTCVYAIDGLSPAAKPNF